MPGQITSVPAIPSRSMISFTASAAATFTACPALCPSPCPGAPSICGWRYATPGVCDDFEMPSTSRPRGRERRGGRGGYGSAKTNRLLPRLGRSSGVRRMLSCELSDEPVLATTYCTPSTA